MSEVAIYKEIPKWFESQVSVAIGWIKCGDEFLFLQRSSKSRDPFVWAVPGGKVEQDETPLQGMVREMQEETSLNLQAELIKDLGAFYVKTPEWRYTYHMFFIEFQKKPQVVITPEHHDFKWMTLSDCQKMPLMVGQQETIQEFNLRIAHEGC
ncbi:MAG: NUDIX hydrolase [Pseudomonadota bacterium]